MSERKVGCDAGEDLVCRIISWTTTPVPGLNFGNGPTSAGALRVPRSRRGAFTYNIGIGRSAGTATARLLSPNISRF